MSKPWQLVQLSDPHIGATWAAGDAQVKLAAAVDRVRELPDSPEVVLVTGDLTEHGDGAEYEIARRELSRLEAPLYVLPGNHDDREVLREVFELGGEAGTPIAYSADLGPMRLVVIDSSVPNEAWGRLDDEQLAWLDAELAEAQGQATMLAMHHPPLRTGSVPWDAIGLPTRDRLALGEVLERHPQVRRVVAGHVHIPIVSAVGGCPVLAAPSTYDQARFELGADSISFGTEPPGYAIHALLDGEIVSYVQAIPA
jgi:3',5'-cyclic-AMP phosphodiesterase